MAKGLSVSIKGLDEVVRRLSVIGNSANDELGRAMYAHAQDVIAESVERHVPRMDSELANSAYVSKPTSTINVTANGATTGGPVVTMGFRAKHAAVTHENPRAGKTGGVSPSGRRYKKWAKVGHWKYLSIPLNNSAKRYQEAIANVVRRAFAQKLASGR